MSYYRPSWIEINLANLQHNFFALKKKIKPGVKVLAVIKADGYGHGAIPLAQKLVELGVDFLGVASIEEGIILRQAQINCPILILGSIYPFKFFPLLWRYRLSPTVASLEVVEELARLAIHFARPLPLHLEIDTGMSRIGVTPERALELARKIFNSPGLILEGVYTHFACATVDEEYSLYQLETFQECLRRLKEAKIKFKYAHLANSAVLLRYPQAQGGLVRPGLLIYGIFPYPKAKEQIDLKPLLTLKTRIVFLKKVPPERRISYCGTYRTKGSSLIATLPIGYADGYNRLLSNQGEVLIRGRRFPVAGRVTMDMTMIDLFDFKEAKVGEEVVLLGKQGEEEITVDEIAEKIGTISYEVVCNLNRRVPRIYINKNGK